MRERQGTKVYPPRVMLTVAMTKVDPSPCVKLPFRFIGSTDDSDLDVEIVFPLGMDINPWLTEGLDLLCLASYFVCTCIISLAWVPQSLHCL